MEVTERKLRGVQWAAAAGTAAPLWFWATLIGLALVHGTIDVSGHQLLRYGIFMYLGFFAYGSLTEVFVWSLRRGLTRRRRSSAAIAALTVFGCGPLLATFTTGSEKGPPQNWHSWLHFSGFLIFSLIPMVAMPLFAIAVWGDPCWRPFGPLSLAWAVAVAVVVFLPSSPAEGYPLWSGPGSMADIALVGAWQILLSRRLAQLARRGLIAPKTSGTQ